MEDRWDWFGSGDFTHRYVWAEVIVKVLCGRGPYRVSGKRATRQMIAELRGDNRGHVVWFRLWGEIRRLVVSERRTVGASGAGGRSLWFVRSSHGLRLLFLPRVMPGGFEQDFVAQLRETFLQHFFETPQIGRSLHIAAEAEVHHTVVAEDGAVDRHLAPDGNVRVPIEHLVAEQVQRNLRPGHVRADQVEGRDGELARDGSGKTLHGEREHTDQSSGQADQFGGVHALEELGALVNGLQQPARIANVERNGRGNEGDAISPLLGAAALPQIDGNHDPQQLAFHWIAMQLAIAPHCGSHDSKNDVIDAGAAFVADCLDLRQRNFGAGKSLRT